MRLRHVLILSASTFALGAAIWVYDNAASKPAMGEGGLPLIKASLVPVRTEPDDPGGEVIPHADSTVFAAMSRTQEADPSMTGLKLPERAENAPALQEDEEDITSPEFAGLNTGFALRSAPESKVESLFSTDEGEASEVATQNSENAASESNANCYLDGLTSSLPSASDQPEPTSDEASGKDVEDDSQLAEIKEEKEHKPIKTSSVKIENVEKPVDSKPQDTENKAQTAPVAEASDQAGLVARNLEEQEKQVLAQNATIKPVSKPSVPVNISQNEAKTPEPQPQTQIASASSAVIAKEPLKKPEKEAAKEPVKEIVKEPVKEIAKPAPKAEPAPQPMQAPKAPTSSVGMAPIVSEGAAPVQTSQNTGNPAPAQPGQGAGSGGYVMQLSSMPSQAEAERSWLKLTSMYPEALRGLRPSYSAAEIEGRGRFIRVRAGVLSRDEANARCNQILREDPKSGGCIVVRE